MRETMRQFNADFDAVVARHGERVAIISTAHPERKISYRELDGLIDRQAAAFARENLRPGDCVGSMMPNSVEQLCLFLACLRSGLRFAPLACDITPKEIEPWAKVMKPSVCCLGSLVAKDFQSTVERQGIPCRVIDADGDFGHLPGTVTPAARGAGSKVQLFSSGTTGQPKAIVLDADRLWSAGCAFLASQGIDEQTPFRIWNYLPHSYLGGLFNMGLIPFAAAGSTVVDETFSGKTFLGFWQTVDRYDINILWLVPTIVRGLLAISDRTHRDGVRRYDKVISHAFLGTAPIDLGTKRRFETVFRIPLLENFALSETTFLTSERPQEDGLRSEGSVGRMLPWVELSFRAAEQEDDPKYREIAVKTPFIAEGYLDENGALSRTDPDEWFPTGDLGYLDASGQLVLTGRSKDIIKKGGHFVALQEVERLAAAHPSVSEAAAVPGSHSFYGEVYRLHVCLKSDAPADAIVAVREYVYGSLARYKWPEDIEVADDLPRTGSGKVRKFLLRQP